jgi:ATP-dependent phosphoenolpyruvate carboxykinase
MGKCEGKGFLPPHKNDYAELKKERLSLINSKIWLEWEYENDIFGCSSI